MGTARLKLHGAHFLFKVGAHFLFKVAWALREPSAFAVSTPFYPIYGVDLPQKVLVADVASFKMLLK